MTTNEGRNGMANVDAFGLRLGTKNSVAASLWARPEGATMGEVIEATGDGGTRVTKHNLLRQLKGDGHIVIVQDEGKEKRYFLKHKDGIVINTVAKPKEWSLPPEKKLKRAIRASLNKLEPGLVAIDGGREEENRDITARDRAGNIVVIEVWTGKARPDKVCQLLGYMGKIKAAPSGLRGILIAADFRDDAVATASLVPTIALKRYNFVGQNHLTFESA